MCWLLYSASKSILHLSLYETLIRFAMLCLLQGNADALLRSPETGSAESLISSAVQWLRLGVETVGAIIIGVGVILAIYKLLVAVTQRETEDYNSIRLGLARYLALALEFQLGADILSTAVAPSWNEIGKLGAVAVIRTGLNYFLMREMQQERVKAGKAQKSEEALQ